MHTNTEKKILIATGIFPPDIGGPASFVPKIALELSKRGHKVHVLTYSNSIRGDDKEQFDITRVYRSKSRIVRYTHYLLKVFKLGSKVDIIFAQCPFASGLPTLIANIFLGKKLVIRVVGDIAWETAVNKNFTRDNIDVFNIKNYGFSGITFLKTLQVIILKSYPKLIVPSQYFKKIIENYVGTNNSDKIYIVHNSFDLISFAEINQAKKKKQMGYEKSKIILAVARLVAWKNIDKLIEAMSLVDVTVQLLIVGDGPKMSKYTEIVHSLGLDSRVKFLGMINKRQLYELYQLADAFVLISDYEGQSHTLLEAMYMGLPTLVSNRGGNPETVQGYPIARVLESYLNITHLAEAMQTLVSLKREPIGNAFTIEKYGYDDMIERTLRILFRD